MEFELTTYELQYLMIALLNSEQFEYGVFSRKAVTDHPNRKEAYEKFDSLLCKMNWMCNPENNYTVKVTVKE